MKAYRERKKPWREKKKKRFICQRYCLGEELIVFISYYFILQSFPLYFAVFSNFNLDALVFQGPNTEVNKVIKYSAHLVPILVLTTCYMNEVDREMSCVVLCQGRACCREPSAINCREPCGISE